MTVEEKLQAILTGSPAIVALVPADRIKVPGDWQSLQVPYIVHQPLVGRTIHAHSGLQPLRLWDFYQIEVYAQSHGLARQIAETVISELDGFADADVQRIAAARTPSAAPYDTDRKLACVTVDFEVAGHLT